jgi:PIN domain nuclease of toxin-antitoxin system
MNLLIDTHAFLWFVTGDPAFRAYDVPVIW